MHRYIGAVESFFLAHAQAVNRKPADQAAPAAPPAIRRPRHPESVNRRQARNAAPGLRPHKLEAQPSDRQHVGDQRQKRKSSAHGAQAYEQGDCVRLLVLVQTTVEKNALVW